MRQRRPFGARASRAAAPALAFLLTLASLPFAPAVSRAQEAGASSPPAGAAYRQTNLVSDLPGVAFVEDKLLVNPWGIAAGSFGPLAVANEWSDTATFYSGDVQGGGLVRYDTPEPPPPSSLRITPPPSALPTRAQPTGVAVNETLGFNVPYSGGAVPARYLFATLTGTISAWHAGLGNSTVVVVNRPGARYTGIARGGNASGQFLYAADFAAGRIDVYDSSFTNVSALMPGQFQDATVPPDFHPYNVQNLGGSLYVTYAQFNPHSLGPNSGVGFGYVRKFSTGGVRDATFNPGTLQLNAPWGLAIAPSNFGVFSNALLVANTASALPTTADINAFDPATGTFLGPVLDEAGAPLKIPGLMGLSFGNGTRLSSASTLYFTSTFGVPSQPHGLLGSLRPTVAEVTSFIQFSAAQYFTSEGAGRFDVTVTRTGDASGTATVDYATYDESLTQKSDYEIALGTLRFAAGETSKTFRVLIVEDNDLDGGVTLPLGLALSNAVGAGLATPNRARLFVMGNEFDTPKPGNPIDEPGFFVRQHYLDFLNREPDASGLAFWTNQVTNCGNPDLLVCRINVSAAFFLSIEFQETGYLVYRAHRAAFGRLPRYGAFMRDTQAVGRGVVVGEGDWRAQLEANKTAFFDDLVTRTEFLAKYPPSMSNLEFVDALLASAQVNTTTGRAFATRLTGAQVVPPATTPAAGTGTVRIASVTSAGDRDFVSLSFSNLSSAQTAAHIHCPARAGSNAPVVADLPLGQFSEFRVDLPLQAARDLRNGLCYMDVHTANFPDGEIRGQLPVQRFFRDVLFRALEEGVLTRAGVVRMVAEDEDFRTREKNPAFVLMQYFGYLRRNPEDPPDSDLSGYDFWLAKLNRFGGNFIAAEMVKAFITSPEYRRRVGQN